MRNGPKELVGLAALGLAAFALNKHRIAGVDGAFILSSDISQALRPRCWAMSARLRWVSSSPDFMPSYAGIDFIRIAAIYRFFRRAGRLQGISTSAENAKISAGISQTGDFTMAQQRAAGAQHRHYTTDWEHMTDKQKFDFLYGWCHKLEATLDGRRKVIYGVKAELQKVQKKLEGEI